MAACGRLVGGDGGVNWQQVRALEIELERVLGRGRGIPRRASRCWNARSRCAARTRRRPRPGSRSSCWTSWSTVTRRSAGLTTRSPQCTGRWRWGGTGNRTAGAGSPVERNDHRGDGEGSASRVLFAVPLPRRARHPLHGPQSGRLQPVGCAVERTLGPRQSHVIHLDIPGAGWCTDSYGG